MVHTNVDLFIILVTYKYYIIFFSTPYLQCVLLVSYCKCIQELFANNTENTQDFIFFNDKVIISELTTNGKLDMYFVPN